VCFLAVENADELPSQKSPEWKLSEMKVRGFHRTSEALWTEKVEGKVVRVLNYAPRHEDVWGSVGVAPPFLTSALDVGEWSGTRPSRFTPGMHWIGGCVGPRAGLDVEKKKKNSYHCRESNPGRPTSSPLLYRLNSGQHTADS
jgi:hypothetical protein